MGTISSPCSVQSLPALFALAGLQAARGALPDVTITSFADDSRKVEQGGCFVAVRGVKGDGHDFVQAAARAGARVVVVEREISAPAGVLCVCVNDTREAIARLGAAFYGLRGEGAQRLRLIGITGTNGKTTVSWMLRAITQAAGKRAALLGTVEYDLVTERRTAPLTTPGPLELCEYLAQARDAGAGYGILEVSSHALDQRRTDGLHFDAAVFTNLSGDHLDYHGDMEAYWRAKRRLFDSLDAHGVAVVNFDDPMGVRMAQDLRARVVGIGIEAPRLDVRAHIQSMGPMGSRWRLQGRSLDVEVRSALVGRHNVMNAVAAAATAEELGLSPEAIRVGLEGLKGVPGRLQRVEPEGHPFSVFVDYAHTDDALRNALAALRPLTRGRMVCVFGCGGDRDRGKRPRMGAVVASMADVAYVTSDNPRTEDPAAIIREILPGIASATRCHVVVEQDRKRAIEAAMAEARPGDTVLIAGKGHETYQLIGDHTMHFDDAEVARGCLASCLLPLASEKVA